MTKKISLVLFLLLTISASGCATIFGESAEVIELNSKPQGAKVSIYNKAGKKVFVGTTPTLVSLKKKQKYFEGEDYVVNFRLPHYQTHTVYLNRSYSGWYLANVLNIFGLFLIDPFSGSMWTYSPDYLKPILEQDRSELID